MERKQRRTLCGQLIFIATLALLVLLTLLFPSCRSVREAAGESHATVSVRTDTVRLANIQRDSVYLHDSVYIKEWQKGDTAYLAKYVTKYAWRDRWRVDTVYKSKTDTVRVTDYAWREKVTERKPWAWMVATFAGFAAALFALLNMRRRNT